MKSSYKRNLQAEQFYKTLKQKTNYPVGTIAYYGPDDQTVTKITVGILISEETDPILKKWTGQDVASDPEIAVEIGGFFQAHGVQDVVMTNGIIGCPHEEGIDYAVGESCPHCPYWQNNQ
jgi:hypothetical protein